MKRFMLIMACLLMVVGGAMAQNRKVTGVVTDASDGKPLQGVRVFVNQTSVGTVTDARGVFELSVPSQYQTLTISSIGYATQEAPVSSTMNIKLQVNEKLLDEAIVVAYGTAKKSAFTGSAKEVKSEEIAQHVTSNALNAVTGKVAGVSIQNTGVSGGDPTSNSPTIKIRGIGTMSASSTPLYIVDGAPTEFGIQNINPQDIESISIQKDAAANAIYGARGANGVIIVTTKKGKKDEAPKVTFDAKWGSNSQLIPQYEKITSAAGYYETVYKALYNSKIYHGYTAAEAYAFADAAILDENNGGVGMQVYTVPTGEKFIGTNFKLNPNAKLGYTTDGYYYTPDNWYDEVIKNAFRQEYSATVSGGSEKINYYASVGYLDDNGIVNNSGYQRYTGRTNVDFTLNKYLKLTTNMSFTHGDSKTPSYNDSYGSTGNMFYSVNMMAPIYPLYVRNADGSIQTEGGRIVYDANQTAQRRATMLGNPVRDNEYDKAQSYSDLFNGMWQATVTPLEGLSLSANYSVQAYNSRYSGIATVFGGGSSNDGYISVSHSRTLAVNQNYLANYTHTFADVHNLTLLAGYEQYKIKDQSLSGSNTNAYNPMVGELNNAKGTSKKLAKSATDNLMREGFLGRVQYDYDNKYFASASIRRDASSKFAPGHRWGTFGSFGLAWQMNKEEFMKDIDWIDLMKVKASWGAQGNDGGMGYHIYADTYTTTYNEESGEYSITMQSKGNDKITWETNKEWNFGVEFELFKSRLNGSIEWYTRKTTDLLYSKYLPASSGFTVSTYYSNVGSMLNHGLEIALEGVAVKNKKMEWDINLNLSTNHNEILELDPKDNEAGGIKYSNQIIREGGSIQEAYMVKYAGVNKSTGEALYYKDVKDASGNVTGRTTTTDITAATKYDCGDLLPSWQGGFGTTFKAYGFDFGIQFAFQLGGKIYDGSYQQLMHFASSAGKAMHKDVLNAWTPTNTNTNIPRLSTEAADDGLGSKSQTPMDFFLTSSNYLSLNNITLGYTLPKNIVNAIKLQNVRVYLTGENLFLLTKRKGLDPRYNYGIGSMTSGQGLASGAYSQMRNITAGVSITF